MYLQYNKNIQVPDNNIMKIYSNITIARYIGMPQIQCPQDICPSQEGYLTINERTKLEIYYRKAIIFEPDHVPIFIGAAPIRWSNITKKSHGKYKDMIVNQSKKMELKII